MDTLDAFVQYRRDADVEDDFGAHDFGTDVCMMGGLGRWIQCYSPIDNSV